MEKGLRFLFANGYAHGDRFYQDLVGLPHEAHIGLLAVSEFRLELALPACFQTQARQFELQQAMNPTWYIQVPAQSLLYCCLSNN